MLWYILYVPVRVSWAMKSCEKCVVLFRSIFRFTHWEIAYWTIDGSKLMLQHIQVTLWFKVSPATLPFQQRNWKTIQIPAPYIILHRGSTFQESNKQSTCWRGGGLNTCFAYCLFTDPTSLNTLPTLWFIIPNHIHIPLICSYSTTTPPPVALMPTPSRFFCCCAS